MKTDQAEVVNDSGRKLPKQPPRIVKAFITFYSVHNSWQRLLSVHDSAFKGAASIKEHQAKVVNDNGRKLPKVRPWYCESVH